MLRFPDGMRERLKAEAARNGRSLNAEIIHRLERSLMTPVERANAEIEEEARALYKRLGSLEAELARATEESRQQQKEIKSWFQRLLPKAGSGKPDSTSD